MTLRSVWACSQRKRASNCSFYSLNVFIIKNVSTNVTHSSTLMIFCIVCYKYLKQFGNAICYNYNTQRTDSKHSMQIVTLFYIDIWWTFLSRFQCFFYFSHVFNVSGCIFVFFFNVFVYIVPSVLWHCWLGVRKSIRPVKIEWWGVGVVICLERGAGCLHMVELMPPHPKTPSSLASFKSRLVLPYWYRLTQVVLGKKGR